MQLVDRSTPADLPPNAVVDVSEVPAPGTNSMAFQAGVSREIRGEVKLIERIGSDIARLDLHDEAGLPRRIAIRMPPVLPFIVRVGERVIVRVRLDVDAGRPVTDGLLLDVNGRMLLANSGSGDEEFAPGWRIELGEELADSPPGQPEKSLVISRGETSAIVGRGAWRRLLTADGEFLVSGRATGSSRRFAMLRLS